MTTPTQLWGDIRQLGYVVPAATFRTNIEHWARMLGVGPWLVIEHPVVEDFVHRGQPGTLDFSFALAQAGSMQIELIAQHNDQPSTYLDFLATTNGIGGLHHLAQHFALRLLAGVGESLQRRSEWSARRARYDERR